MKRKIIAVLLLAALLPSLCFAEATLSFSAEDYSGNVVTQEIFGDYDVTMINVFTTWCIYCLHEMSDLKTLYADLPENANLIAICADAYEQPEDLSDIVSHFNLDFMVLKMTGDQVGRLYNVPGYPTTLFVDGNGKILKVIIGAPKNPLEDYGSVITSLLENAR